MLFSVTSRALDRFLPMLKGTVEGFSTELLLKEEFLDKPSELAELSLRWERMPLLWDRERSI